MICPQCGSDVKHSPNWGKCILILVLAIIITWVAAVHFTKSKMEKDQALIEKEMASPEQAENGTVQSGSKESESEETETQESATDHSSDSNQDPVVSEKAFEIGKDEMDEDGNQTYKITCIIPSREGYLQDISDGMMDFCPSNLKLTEVVSGNDADQQLRLVEEARDEGNDAIIIYLADPSSADSILESAGDIPVLFFEKCPDRWVLDWYNCAYIGADDYQAGMLQGQYLAAYFKSLGKRDISYALVKGTTGETRTDDRSAGAIKALENEGFDIELYGHEVNGDYDYKTTREAFNSLIENGTVDFDCVICNDDEMADSVFYSLLYNSQLDIESIREIPIVGIDGSRRGISRIALRQMAMTAYLSRYKEGYTIITAAMNMAKGKPLNDHMDYAMGDPSILRIPYEPVTINNFRDYIH